MQDPGAAWPHVALTFLGDSGSFGLSAEKWRLIRYANGEEELYHIDADPYEWHNLANDEQYQSEKESLRALAPTELAEKKTVDPSQLKNLEWFDATSDTELPQTRPEGVDYALAFTNQKETAVRVHWISPAGVKGASFELKPSEQTTRRTRGSVVWLVTDLDDRPIGYFQTTRSPSIATIPR